VILSPEERGRLIRLGSELGHEVHDLLSIVTVKTYKRWLREQWPAGCRGASAAAERSPLRSAG